MAVKTKDQSSTVEMKYVKQNQAQWGICEAALFTMNTLSR